MTQGRLLKIIGEKATAVSARCDLPDFTFNSVNRADSPFDGCKNRTDGAEFHLSCIRANKFYSERKKII